MSPTNTSQFCLGHYVWGKALAHVTLTTNAQTCTILYVGRMSPTNTSQFCLGHYVWGKALAHVTLTTNALLGTTGVAYHFIAILPE